MAKPETNKQRVIGRLSREGWRLVGGTKHDKYEHPDPPGVTIMVPRHQTLSIGTARVIAKAAGWL